MNAFSKIKHTHALITGAGKGIGRELALEIGQHVSKLSLIGRNLKNLTEVKSLIRHECETQSNHLDQLAF